MKKEKKHLSRAERSAKFSSILKDKDLMKRILFTLLAFLVFKIGSVIPLSGVNAAGIKTIIDINSYLGLMNMMGGGSLEKMSLFALGVSPYITSGIIIQLLAMDVIPALTEMTKTGEIGRMKMEKVTRYFSVVLCIIQSISTVYLLDKSYGVLETNGILDYAFLALSMTAGSMLLVWLGDKITVYGVGNGISMIIFAGIVSGIPSTFLNVLSTYVFGTTGSELTRGIIDVIGYCIIYLLVILAVIFMDGSQRKIPVHYATTGMGGNMSYIPLKINSASVIPVIFAQSIITAPQIVISFFNTDLYTTVSEFLSFEKPFGLCLYAVLIFFFTFAYTDLTVQPDEMAKNLNQSGAYIPNIRPGKDTENYVRKIMYRISVFGAIGLTIIALMPYLLSVFTSLDQSTAIGGTGIIIVVGVALETMKDIKSRAMHKRQKSLVW